VHTPPGAEAARLNRRSPVNRAERSRIHPAWCDQPDDEIVGWRGAEAATLRRRSPCGAVSRVHPALFVQPDGLPSGRSSVVRYAHSLTPFIDLRLKLITERMLDALAKVGCRLQVVDRSSKVAL